MIPADAHTKLLERRIHNQRVQLAWWANWDGNRWGYTYMRRLHESMMRNRHKHAERRRVEKIEATREGWFRAVVFYQDICAESDPAVIAEADRRWPMPSVSAPPDEDA